MSLGTIDEYLEACAPESRPVAAELRQWLRELAPDAVETISYGMPTFDLHGKHLIFFAVWKRHIGIYPVPAGDSNFEREIARYKREKGSLHLPLNEPLPKELLRQIVDLRRNEVTV